MGVWQTNPNPTKPTPPQPHNQPQIGSFSMNSMGSSKSIIGDFMKAKKKDGGSGFEEGLLKLLRTLPKVLKYLPSDKAQVGTHLDRPVCVCRCVRENVCVCVSVCVSVCAVCLRGGPWMMDWSDRSIDRLSSLPPPHPPIRPTTPHLPQDARSFIMSFQYWLGGSPENIESMLLMLANTYVDEVGKYGPANQPPSQSTNQSINQPTNQPVNQSNQSTNQLTNQSIIVIPTHPH